MYKGKNGQSACPVCKSTRKEASSYSPQFCKISIPKSRISEPYKIEPKKRSEKSNTEDTLSLAEVKLFFNYFLKTKNKLNSIFKKHCVAGYQTAPKKSIKTYNLSKSKTVDLKSATGITNEVSKLTIVILKLIFI